jgi:hypothetical protein
MAPRISATPKRSIDLVQELAIAAADASVPFSVVQPVLHGQVPCAAAKQTSEGFHCALVHSFLRGVYKVCILS